jgi:NADPH:quinone reductase-like Zn-dependent oxidoreductase
MQAVQIREHGEPTSVAKCIDIGDPPTPDAGEVTVAMEFAPIHPHDLVVIRGKSGSRVESTTSFPLTLGTEGVGWICEVGAGVHDA